MTYRCGDDLFGPVIQDTECRRGFDFTLAFQECILTLVPACIFIVLSAPRILYLLRRRDQVARKQSYTLKLAVVALFATLQLALMTLAASRTGFRTRFSIAAAIMSFLAACLTTLLVHAEHVKTIRPSFLLTCYLLLTVIFDMARVRTEWMLPDQTSYATLLSELIAVKIFLLGLETVEKRHILLNQKVVHSIEATSGPFSKGLFIWINSLLAVGWRTVLTLNGLPAIYEELSSEDLMDRFSRKWDKDSRKKNASLVWTTCKVLRRNFLIIAFPRAISIALTLSQPFLINGALKFLSSSSVPAEHGYGLVGAFALVYFGSAISTACYEHLSYRASSMMRGGFIMLIYRKVLRLSCTDVVDSAAVTLMGNDVETLVERVNCLFIECWANGITVIFAIYLLAQQLGAVCVVPVVTAIISLAGIGSLGKAGIKRQLDYQKATEDRINFTAEVVGSCKSVKMLGYTDKFTEFIRRKRNHDIDEGKAFRWITVWSNGISNANVSLTQVATFGAFAVATKVSGSGQFTYTQAITTLSILTVLTGPLTQLMSDIRLAFNSIACFKRIQEFLLLPDRADGRTIESTRNSLSATCEDELAPDNMALRTLGSPFGRNPADISIIDGTFNWKGSEGEALTDINIATPNTGEGSLTMIIGPVGSGKSTLLRAMLGETDGNAGLVYLSASEIAFCDQTPWILNTSIRNNIVAESQGFDEKWYATVIGACELEFDLKQLEDGDATIVGDQGLKLSGGQRSRIAIARAVYSRKPIAIFDDPFSGLDRATEKAVFMQVFSEQGLLKQNSTAVVLATHAVHRLPFADHVIVLSQAGYVIEQGTFNALRRHGNYVKELNIAETLRDNDAETITDLRSSIVEDHSLAHGNEKTDYEGRPVVSDRSAFKYYFASLGTVNAISLTICVSAPAFFSTFRSVWLTWWGNGNGHDASDLGYWMSIFTLLATLDTSFVISAITIALIKVAPHSGQELHEKILNAVMNAPMSVLANCPSGSLLNRFSQDMRFIDFVLPITLVVLMFEICSSIGSLGLAIAAVNWIAITVPGILVVLILIQRFYVRTSKQLRLLEIESKAPLFGHFAETISGLSTIRAYNWLNEYMDKTIQYLDASQKPFYLLNAIQRWLTLALDLTIAVLVTILVALAVSLRGRIDPPLLGVALVHMMTLGMNLKELIIQWSTLETSLGAVSRIKSFVDRTLSENLPTEIRVPRPDWLLRGTLELRNVAVRYNNFSLPVLRNISFSVNHGEKIGICGRSGSGKTSLIQALLRMADISEGSIYLGGENISEVPRNMLRARLSCLTQEPFLFSNTVRFNADPLGEHGDQEIMNSLKRVGLWYIFVEKATDGSDPLDVMMTESMLSHGQRQLFCLGRALLKKTAMLILDEPTSSVDRQTDAMIQQVIRSQFKDRTIIMIAHRLDTLLDFDKIAMLDQGSLVEFDSPRNLLKKPNGYFFALYRAEKKRDTMGDFITKLFKEQNM